MLQHTSLHAEHLKQGALMVNFAGWEMPLHYGSQIEEHNYVRQDAGIFDVSHMGLVDVQGNEAANFLRYVLANNIDKLKNPGRALYSCMLNDQGGVIDDLIVYYLAPNHYWLIINAGTTDKDLTWLLQQSSDFSVNISHQKNHSILAIQGPLARKKLGQMMPELSSKLTALKPFHFFIANDMLIARTGYTGEEGVEIILPNTKGELFWQAALQAGIHPIGLAARDTLRLEAGFNLYGQDMDEHVTPLESNLTWTVAFEPEDRMFIGRKALVKQRETGLLYKLIGLKLIDKGVLRHDQVIWLGNEQVGKVTSGSFSPTLKQSIALARVRCHVDHTCTVDIRGKQLKAEITSPPFLRRTHNE